jgi:transposase InsO family protein
VHASREVPHTQTKADLWHSRLGHQGQNVLTQINAQHKINLSLSDLKQAEQHYCQSCVKGKLSRQAIHSTADHQYKAEHPLQCLHADLVGPVTTTNRRNHPRCPTIGGSIYALVVTDEYTHTVWVRLLWNKSEATAELIKLITQVQIRTGRIVERFHSDGGGEFTGSMFRSFLDTQGTRFTRSTPSTPSRNGIAERMNRTLFEITRTLLIESAAPDVMWGGSSSVGSTFI